MIVEDGGDEVMTREYPEFNESFLFFLPQKTVATTEGGADVFDPDGVRPLNVTNTDNRLLASATRIVIESMLEGLLTEDQRGFLPGRSMLANLLDIDEAMLLGALKGDGSMTLFYDFAAAFPSIEHDLLTDVFKSFGWPDWLLNIVNRLYSLNFCQIVLVEGGGGPLRWLRPHAWN